MQRHEQAGRAEPSGARLPAYDDVSLMVWYLDSTSSLRDASERHQWGGWKLARGFTYSSASLSADCIDVLDRDEEEQEPDDSAASHRHALEVAHTERFLAADLRRRVQDAHDDQPPLTKASMYTKWLSWGRGSMHEAHNSCPTVATQASAPHEAHGKGDKGSRGKHNKILAKLRNSLPKLSVTLPRTVSKSFQSPRLNPDLSLPTLACAAGSTGDDEDETQAQLSDKRFDRDYAEPVCKVRHTIARPTIMSACHSKDSTEKHFLFGLSADD